MRPHPALKGFLSALLHLALAVLVPGVLIFFIQWAFYLSMSVRDMRSSLLSTCIVLGAAHGLFDLTAIQTLMQPIPGGVLRTIGYIIGQGLAIMLLFLSACCIAGHLAAYLTVRRRNKVTNGPHQTDYIRNK